MKNDLKWWNYTKSFDHFDYSLRVVNKENIWGYNSSFYKPTFYTSAD